MLSFEVLLALAVTFSTITSLILFSLPSGYEGKDETSEENDRVRPRFQVLVLGDIGRSPRMQYHAISIAKHGGLVDLIGYKDSELHPAVLKSPFITVHAILRSPQFLDTSNRSFFLFYGPLKVLFQCWALWTVLGSRTKPAKWMLVQNPPSIPTLAIAQAICFIRHTRLIIDWHNFGYSILALKLGSNHPLVRISKWYEFKFSQNANAAFTVTKAMARVLKRDYKITTPVLALHDRPASHFHPGDRYLNLAFLGRLPETASLIDDLAIRKLKLLVSSTSWTADEDFSLLLDALVGYSELATTSHPHLPELLVVVTGKGPQKEHYLSQVNALKAEGQLEMITIKTAWLSTEDYASLLAAADLGVSLHTSSSGVDLPMKVVDMFGAGLPVVGWGEYEAWSELVKEGVNGRGFASAGELQAILVEVLGDDGEQLIELKKGAIDEGRRRWDDEWDPIAGRLFGLC